MDDVERKRRHRHNMLLDKVYWQQYTESLRDPVMHLDYSQNIKLVEKNQVQSAHFSGRQQTLHDSLIQQENVSNTYIYHLSDDTNHDNIMTRQIIKSILEIHPEIYRSGVLYLRSDNCSTQYKSRYVFFDLSSIPYIVEKSENIFESCTLF